ncbi:DUF2108 domain-containing protein [Methanococcus aeolicus]|jgi:energy-converting hydrogenase A subunit D|uniref:Energy-converting hydrogenase A, subunit D n=1 Tax=Methanococcus aeolicus (strain ATCC BAA-1280 / DSM 17508 / OCM 812 / Nankai-3) TaxID=419665 RepID=A6UTX5_META3|nr:DUF2108 domain-containing protein [Methanococcus aeolicus]ABR55947.1 conserved hypothetical protein [Methanococcus aeolicus Nankai-3]UXM85454.1 DUF2108 domain-containing protein [Methanococcus aeolicus]
MEILPLVALFCCVFGGIGVILHTDILNKIIMFAFLEAGLIGLVASFYYLDVAMVSSILEPISTIVLLLGAIKYTYLIKTKKRYSSELPILSK